MRSSVFFLLASTTLQAQTASWKARIIDATDSLPISGVQVYLDGSRAIRSDGYGQFTIANVPAGRHEVTVRMLGYAAWGGSVDFVAGETLGRDIVLTRVPRLLSTMVVHGRSVRVPSGFESVYARGAKGDGVLITRERIDSLSPRDVTSLLSTETNAHVSGYGGGYTVTTPRCRIPMLFLNGMPIQDTVSRKEILQFLAPTNVQAIEFYDGTNRVPMEFQPACGAIVVWTRKQ